MIIVPYAYSSTKVSNEITRHTIKILCEGGRKLWSEDEQPLKDILEPNDIYYDSVKQHKDDKHIFHLVKVNTEKTDISSMFSWNEIEYSDNSTLCWITLTLCTNSDNSVWLPLPGMPFQYIANVILKTEHHI
jgi:hypothetical protein